MLSTTAQIHTHLPTYTCIHTSTHMSTHYCFTLRMLILFNLFMFLIYYFPLFVINLCLSMSLCLISVVSCFGVNTQRGENWN